MTCFGEKSKQGAITSVFPFLKPRRKKEGHLLSEDDLRYAALHDGKLP